ncbi:hypothetical protein BO70DRAFT_364388 [Aspergillus heteromorphus CBS 117.55]|uniref:Uncharacterized protein n=1 Tax=Aspergillus heteromorphus CBS 117.55 TaxID=1448321 RepID=A0A317VNJ4_9EURO|nr:uncharacterized protein BO70DRAFT_364388 [Aspergillus heteromorphus CBS 117.55]PWY74422.1 hypothetical protein BO70DRAFT_364388 [Aspergillus heteromorphus CBS 117.55]
MTIPRFLLPRGAPSALTLRALTLRTTTTTTSTTARCASTSNNSNKHNSSSSSNSNAGNNPRVLAKPDKFRPPSHPARRVVQPRNGKATGGGGPINYPGPKLSEQEIEEQKTKQYPNMFPPEGTVMFKFLTHRWIHIWIAMSVLISLATFTFTVNFKRNSPFAHLLPPWSALLGHPFSTISQAVSVFRMHVEHTSMQTRENRRRRVDDAEKRRQYRVAHGLEEPDEKRDGKIVDSGDDAVVVDEQSPVAVEEQGAAGGSGKNVYVDWEGNKRPAKRWLGIW